MTRNDTFKLLVSALVIIGLGSAFSSELTRSVSAQTSSVIDATTKISVCGDALVEGPEECEGIDLQGASCSSLGYNSGTLTCDIACEYDLSACAGSPQPSPSPTASPVTDSALTSGTASVVTATSPAPLPLKLTSIVSVAQRSVLPLSLSFHDQNKNGVLDENEQLPALETWVSSWKEVSAKPELLTTAEPASCDVNDDKNCNAIDFSVLLYYIEKNT